MSVEVTGDPDAIGVNDDGSRVAATVDHILTVYDTASRHELASVRVAFSRGALQFVSPNIVRIFAPTGEGLRVTDFDVRTRKLSEVTPPIPIANQYDYVVVGSTLMVRNTSAVEIRNLAAGTVDTISLQKDDGLWLMRDGRWAIFHRAAPATIEIRRNGTQQRLIRFGRDAQGVRVMAEIGRGKLLVSTYGRQRFDTTTYIVDADSGAMSSPPPRATPALSWPTGIGITDPDVKYRALLRYDTGKIDAIDLQTGAIRPLFR